MAKVLSFTEITEKLSSPGTVLLDVREKGELTTDGKISGSRNIPGTTTHIDTPTFHKFWHYVSQLKIIFISNCFYISRFTFTIAVGEFAVAMNMKDQDFESKYGFKKPYPSDDIVIHCKAGVRAQNAAKVLMSSGYVNVQ